MCKNSTFLKEIIFKYLPDHFPTTTSKKLALEHPDVYKVERLTEFAFAKVGGYNFVDAEHYDFSDGSEAKTASIRENPVTWGGNTFAGEISNIVSAGGTYKSGDIRVCLYVPHTQSIRYFFIPNKELPNIKINVHPTTKIGRIMFTYYRLTGRIKKLEKYEVENFETLATLASIS